MRQNRTQILARRPLYVVQLSREYTEYALWEEEGIPYDVQPREGLDLLELAHHASVDSRIGVGIGISKEGIVLQYEKLDKSAPLFKIKLYQKDLYRKIGSNAARLVKKMPFKAME